jgi:hypothetical protein
VGRFGRRRASESRRGDFRSCVENWVLFRWYSGVVFPLVRSRGFGFRPDLPFGRTVVRIVLEIEGEEDRDMEAASDA